MPPQQNRIRRFLVFSPQECCVIGLTVLAVHFFKAVTGVRVDSDFITFYASAFRAELGESMYFVGRNHNPPHFHLLMLPLTAVRPTGAWLLWTAASFALAYFVIRLSMKASTVPWTTHQRWVLAACVLNAAAVQATLRLGQVSWLIAAFVSLAWLFARRHQWVWAGVLAGFAISLKPFLLVLLAMFALRRQWLALTMAASVCTATLSVGVLVFGWENFAAWVALLRTPPTTEHFDHLLNASIAGFVSRAGAPMLIATVLSVSLLGLSVWRGRKAHEDIAWVLCVVAALLASPLGHIYYALLCVGPLIVLVHENRLTLPRWAFALFFFPALGKQPFGATPLLSLSIGSIYMWALVSLWIAAFIASGETRSGDSSLSNRRSP